MTKTERSGVKKSDRRDGEERRATIGNDNEREKMQAAMAKKSGEESVCEEENPAERKSEKLKTISNVKHRSEERNESASDESEMKWRK